MKVGNSVTVGNNMTAEIDGNFARFYEAQAFGKKYLGCVWIDHTGAWNVKYEKDVTYLPINSVLYAIGYKQQTRGD